MLHKLVFLFVRYTHPWRVVGSAEMAELYISRMMRVMGLKIMAGFSFIYMYQLGYGLQFLAGFFVLYFLVRLCVSSPLAAVIIARYGPKHASLISNVLQIIAIFTILTLPEYGVWALLVYAPIAGMATTLYDVSYLVDFSKVKHADHAGKELGVMQIVERTMVGLGPLLGGVVALYFGPQAMLLLGAFLMLIAALPLFFTSEPTRTHQKITLRNFNWRTAWRPMLAGVGTGVDMNISGIGWGLFLAIVVFGVSKSNEVYAQIGALGSVSVLASVLCAYYYGKVVDRYKGRKLLKISVFGDMLVHFSRITVVNPLQALVVNIVNEVMTIGYAIPGTRAIFDVADGLPGYRIIFLSLVYAAHLLGDLLASMVLLGLTWYFDEKTALHAIFIILPVCVLLINLHGYYIYRRGIFTRFIHRV